MVKVPDIDDSLFIRTWFGDEEAWQQTLSAVKARYSEGFIAYVVAVDDPANDNASLEDLHEAIDYGEAAVAFLADERAQVHPDHPVLVLDVTGDEQEPFRARVDTLWKVENEMNLSDITWADAVKKFGAV